MIAAPKPPGLLLRMVLLLASTRAGGWFFTTVTPGLDRWCLTKTDGRLSLAGLAIPTLLLTTRGRRSGLPRTAPLLYLPDGNDFLVVGSRGGRVAPPAWYENLCQDPSVTVTVSGTRHDCEATVLRGAERQRCWQRFVAYNPGFARYQRRLERRIPVIRLRPLI